MEIKYILVVVLFVFINQALYERMIIRFNEGRKDKVDSVFQGPNDPEILIGAFGSCLLTWGILMVLFLLEASFEKLLFLIQGY